MGASVVAGGLNVLYTFLVDARQGTLQRARMLCYAEPVVAVEGCLLDKDINCRRCSDGMLMRCYRIYLRTTLSYCTAQSLL